MKVGRAEVAVLGGGITGAFAAWWLRVLGAEVTVIDAGDPGAASVANPGCLNPLHGPGIPGPMLPLALASFSLHQQAWEPVRAASGIEFAPRACTRIAVALDDEDERRLRRRREPYDQQPGFSARWLDRDELQAVRPRLSPAVRGGLETSGDAKVDAASYTRAVRAAALERGARLLSARATGLARRRDRVVAVQLQSGEVRCDALVLATGVWTAQPARWLGVELPLEPVKGELLLAEVPEATEVLWRDAAVYVRDRRTAWLGGTEEHAGFDASPSAGARAAILKRVSTIWPELASARVLGHLAGLRPVSRDGLPIAGMAPGWRNVCLALGGGRKGMLLSAALGRAVAELCVNGASTLPLEPCAPGRFRDAEAGLGPRRRDPRRMPRR